MKRNYVAHTVGLIVSMMRGIGNIFSSTSREFDTGQNGHFKKKTRTIIHGRRSFKYEGTDGNIHRVRVGNAFPVRPAHKSRFFIATNENRLLLNI